MDSRELPSAGFIEDVEIHDAAEDVKEVRFIGSDHTVTVDVTDETMWQFIAVAYEVRDRIKCDVEEMRKLFESFE